MIDLSYFVETLNRKPVAVFGLAKSGLATIQALRAVNECEVYAWDDKDDKRELVSKMGAQCKELTADVLAQCGCLVLSPGVPLTHPEPHPVVKAAQQAGIEIIGDIEILHRALDLNPAYKNGEERSYKTVGITGTNGKSTTTALLTHVLKECGVPAVMGGNIGEPVLMMDIPQHDAVIVLEMSSYQIDLCPTFRPDIGILLNITPDHIDRHGTLEHYAAVKHRLLDGSTHKVYGEKILDKAGALDGHIFISLPGAHNMQNILCVLEACDVLGVEREQAIVAIKTFPGLAHRQFLAGEMGPIRYVNDSKATNAEATSKALASYQNVYWIVGGQAKDGGLKGLEHYTPRIQKAYLIGEAESDFAQWMGAQGIAYTLCGTLDVAVRNAHEDAQDKGEEAVVLLSPACASWDQFKSFEHRGEVFTDLVETLMREEEK